MSLDNHTQHNPAVTYLPKHGATRNVIGRRPLPWQKLDGTDVAIGLDVDRREGQAVLILTSDHDEVHIRLTAAQVATLSDRFIEATYVVDDDVDPTPVEQWEVTEGVSAAERHELAMRVVRDAGRVA